MNIFILLYLVSLVSDIPELPELPRANRRAARAKAIAHNRKVYHDLVGPGIWYENPNENGDFVAYHRSKVTKKSQHGRWETERLSGHRRFQKWSRDYYDSPEVSLDKYFRRVDKRNEKYDELQSADFAKFLNEQREADEKVEELLVDWDILKEYKYVLEDANHPYRLWATNDENVAEAFYNGMREEGAAMYYAKVSDPFSFAEYYCECSLSEINNYENGDNPFYYWYN